MKELPRRQTALEVGTRVWVEIPFPYTTHPPCLGTITGVDWDSSTYAYLAYRVRYDLEQMAETERWLDWDEVRPLTLLELLAETGQ